MYKTLLPLASAQAVLAEENHSYNGRALGHQFIALHAGHHFIALFVVGFLPDVVHSSSFALPPEIRFCLKNSTLFSTVKFSLSIVTDFGVSTLHCQSIDSEN